MTPSLWRHTLGVNLTSPRPSVDLETGLDRLGLRLGQHADWLDRREHGKSRELNSYYWDSEEGRAGSGTAPRGAFRRNYP